MKKNRVLSCLVVLLIMLSFMADSLGAEEVPATNQDGTSQILTNQNEKTANSPPSESVGEKNKSMVVLFKQDFRYNEVMELPNPFFPFIKPAREKSSPEEMAEGAPQKPVLLTPLQKMEIGEIERGFKGILWGPSDKKAIIEDDTGKGYIVSVGTPVGNQDGVVAAIFEDRIVIRQKAYDRKAKNFVDEDVVIKLKKSES